MSAPNATPLPLAVLRATVNRLIAQGEPIITEQPLPPCSGCERTNVPRYQYEAWHVETGWHGSLTLLCEACARAFAQETRVRRAV